MNMKERVETLRVLKMKFLEKQALLVKAKRLREEASVSNLSKLLESDLEQAKLILAAKDVCDRLQKIAEHLAELGAEEIMPLSDAMKGAFGPDAAATFEHSANTNIQNALETVRAAKDSINDAILQVEGKIAPQSDMNQPTDGSPPPPNDMSMADGSTDALVPSTDGSMPQDNFAGAGAAAGPQDEPLGRARKESRQNRKKMVEKSINLTEAGKKILETVKLDKLMNWLFTEAAKTLSGKEFLAFTQSVTSKAINTPEAMAGWIGKKRWGDSRIRRLLESDKVLTRAQKLAGGIATVIETNVSLFGKGKAAQVVEAFTSDLMEGDGSEVLEAFSQKHGCSPALYSLRLAKQMHEDTPPAIPLSPEDKDDVSTAVSQLATKIVADPGMTNQPAINVISGLDPTSKTALQKIAGDTSTGTITNVGQLVKAADDKIKPGTNTVGVGEASGRQAAVAKEIRALGLLIKKDQAGDYVINYKGYKPGEGYFTDDLDDALGTARIMAKKMPKVAETMPKPTAKSPQRPMQNPLRKSSDQPRREVVEDPAVTAKNLKNSTRAAWAGEKLAKVNAYEDEIQNLSKKKKQMANA